MSIKSHFLMLAVSLTSAVGLSVIPVSSALAAEAGERIERRDLRPDTTPRGAELEKSENVANPQERPSKSSDGIKRDFSSLNKARSPSRDVTPGETNVDRGAADNAPTGEREQRRAR